MTPRDTHTGRILEHTIIPALKGNGYKVSSQKVIGDKFDGTKHRVDVLTESPEGREILVSLKWQQVGGTVEEKLPFEVIKLIHAIKSSGGRFAYAYIVIAGEGMRRELKKFYMQGGLKDYIKDADLIHIVSLDQFIALANQGKL